MDNLAGVLSSSEVEHIQAFPSSPYLQQLENDPNLLKHDFVEDFPILKDEVIQKIWGTKGRPFSRHMQFKFFWNPKEHRLFGVIGFPRDTEGPPGCVHGGCIATALDSALGTFVLRLCGLGCVTLNLNTNYKKFIPIESCVRLECWEIKREGRKVFCAGKLCNIDDGDQIYSEATAIFYKNQPTIPDYEQCLQVFGRPSGITRDGLIKLLKSQKKQEAKL
eukprot:TRINITY_DN110_c0_g1_i1.p1 TRINITY_DN110_c0_g1~~TRINITY_DN110_c0_g1_i1.p1  ORF type:complete len:220 (-),score=52.56 TRINITY_DN110_c0_g1_i1:66-725(-)